MPIWSHNGQVRAKAEVFYPAIPVKMTIVRCRLFIVYLRGSVPQTQLSTDALPDSMVLVHDWMTGNLSSGLKG